jgi:hypothetical protein
VVALASAPLLAPVERDTGDKGASSHSAHPYEDLSIRGSMTLREIEETTGVPATYIINALKLPDTISVEERPGPLKR